MHAPEAYANLDCATVYRGLSHIFARPEPDRLLELRREWPELRAALGRLGIGAELQALAREIASRLAAAEPARLESAWHATFGPGSGPACPPNEASYTAPRAAASALRARDVAAFYHALGVAVAQVDEAPDDVRAELEFMHVLAVKLALACVDEAREPAREYRAAARRFLADHLGRWLTPFAERLAASAGDPLYAAAGRLAAGFVAQECLRLAAHPVRGPAGGPGGASDPDA